MWIGAKTSNGTSDWTWDDKTAFDYSHWEDGEDDGNDGFCSYLTYNNERKWKDAPCDATGNSWGIEKYMCKKYVGMFLKRFKLLQILLYIHNINIYHKTTIHMRILYISISSFSV